MLANHHHVVLPNKLAAVPQACRPVHAPSDQPLPPGYHIGGVRYLESDVHVEY